MSQLLWRLYLEDDVETFCQILDGSGVAARPSAHRWQGAAQNAFKIGSPGNTGKSPVGGLSSYKDVSAPFIFQATKGGVLGDIVLTRADINRKDSKGMTLLHYAASSTNENSVKFALSLIAQPLIDLYQQDLENGWTALHRSLYFGNITIARAILEREAQDITGEGQGGLNATTARLIRVKDREGNGPFDLLTETIKDRTLHHQNMGANFRGSDAGDDDDDAVELQDQDDGLSRSSSGLVQPSTQLAGDEVYMFGSNRNITLGLGNEDDRQFPERVTLRRPDHLFRRFLREHFEKRAQTATMASASYAEKMLGVSKANNEAAVMPSVIQSLPLKVQDVQMSKFHSAILTDDPNSNLFVTGHGPGGRLGTGNEQTMFNFICIDDFAGARKKIVAVALGQDHTLAVTNQGELYAWGSNVHGQQGTGMSRTSLNTEEPSQLVPKQLFGQLKKEVIVGVAASRIHSVAHTSTSIYTWGRNEGQLGIVDAQAGTLEIQSTPRRVGASRISHGIQSVSATERATVCLLENHEVHVFANYGMVKLQFPLDGFTNYFLKETVRSTRYDERPNTIVKVTCGGDTICALASSGEIFAVTVDQRVKPEASSTTSTTNPNKIRAALSFPTRIWSLKKGHMNARDVGVDQDGSIVLTTEAGSVWRRVRRANATGSRQKSDKKSKDYKFSRVPGLTRVIAVRSSGSGAYCSVRRDCDVTRTQIAIERPSLATDVGKLLPFRNLEAFEADTADNPVATFWTRPTGMQRLVACLVSSKDPEKDIDLVLKSRSNEYCSNFDALVKSTVCEITIPVHTFLMACRSPVILDALACAQRTGSWECDLLSISISDQGKTTFLFKGVDFLTLVELVLYVYTDEFVGFWLRARSALDLAHRYRQIRLEVMRIASRLELRNFESVARRMAPMAQPCMNLDLEMALPHWSFLDSGDTVIQLSDGEQLVHSDLLSRRCPFFEGMFQGRAGGRWLAERREMLNDATEAVGVDFTHVEIGTFRLVLRYLYADSGEELFDEIIADDLDEFIDVVLDVLSLANELMLDRLSEICQKVLGRHVNVRNVCSLLNAVAPSAIPEFKNSALEYICLNLETMLTSQLLDELDEDILHDLDQVVRDNQLSTLPFAKSGRAEALLLDKYPELASRIDRDRQAKLDALIMQAKYTDHLGAFGTSLNTGDDEDLFAKSKRRPRTPSVQASPSILAQTPTPRSDTKAYQSKQSLGASPSPQLWSTPTQLASPPRLDEAALDSPGAFVDLGTSALAHEPFAASKMDIEASPITRPWEGNLVASSKLGIREIMEQAASSHKSGISMGLASQAENSTPGSFGVRVSQKERRKQHQARRITDNILSSSPSPTASTTLTTQSPWQTVSKAKIPPTLDPSPAELSKSSQATPITPRRSTTPHLTMRQTVAKPPSRRKGREQPEDTQSPQTPPTQHSSSTLQMTDSHSRPTPSTQQNSSATKPVEIQSIRHTPRPDAQMSPSLYMHQSMADILALQQAEKINVKEAVAKRSLQEIQQEQEFLTWWDAESKRAKEEEEAAAQAAGSKSRGGGIRRGRRGPRRGRGKEPGSERADNA